MLTVYTDYKIQCKHKKSENWRRSQFELIQCTEITKDKVVWDSIKTYGPQKAQ